MSAHKSRRLHRTRAATEAPAPVATAPVADAPLADLSVPEAPAGTADAAADRATLIRTCIYLRDRVTSTALAQRLDQALAEVGVTTLNPVGERFDPSRHEAAGVEATQDPAHVGTVAMVEAPGYADRGVLLRPPVVTVYQASAAGQPNRRPA